MTITIRDLFKIAAVLGSVILFVPSAFADTKVKTRMTMGGQSPAQSMGLETMIYVKDARQRVELSLAMGVTMVSLYQCDQKRTIQMNCQCKTYMISSLDDAGPAAQPSRSGKGGVVNITVNSTDTGERQQMFSRTARHIKATMAFEPGPGACNSERMTMDLDGWFIDLPAQLSCAASERTLAQMRPSKGGCQDEYRFKTTGSGTGAGLPVKLTFTMKGPDGKPFSMTQEAVEVLTTTLDPALFDIPAGYREVKDPLELMCLPQGISSISQVFRPPQGAAPSQEREARDARIGVLRIGIVPFQNKTGKSLNGNALRARLIEDFRRMGAEAVPLDSEAEAREKQCEFVLHTDLAQLKEPSTKKKIGGLLGRAAGVGSGDAGGAEATVEFRLQPAAQPQRVRLSSSATGKAASSDESVASALERAAGDVMSELRKR